MHCSFIIYIYIYIIIIIIRNLSDDLYELKLIVSAVCLFWRFSCTYHVNVTKAVQWLISVLYIWHSTSALINAALLYHSWCVYSSELVDSIGRFVLVPSAAGLFSVDSIWMIISSWPTLLLLILCFVVFCFTMISNSIVCWQNCLCSHLLSAARVCSVWCLKELCVAV